MNSKIQLSQLVSKYNANDCPVPQINIKYVDLKKSINKQLSEKAILQPDQLQTHSVRNFEFELTVTHNLEHLLQVPVHGVIQTQNKVLVDLVISPKGIETKNMEFNQSPSDIKIVSKDSFTYINSSKTEVTLPLNMKTKCIDLSLDHMSFVLRSQLKTAVPKIKIRSLIEEHLKNSPEVHKFIDQHSSIQLN